MEVARSPQYTSTTLAHQTCSLQLSSTDIRMQNHVFSVLLAAALVGFAAASPLAGDENTVFHRVRRNKPCTFDCSTIVVGDGLNVQDNPKGDHHRVITNQGSWGSSSGYQPASSQIAGGGQEGSQEAASGQRGSQEAAYGPGGSQRPGAGGDRLTAGGGWEEPSPSGGQGKPNDVKISQPCLGCTLDVQGRGNIVRS